jgi:hypothetical protein
LFAALVGLGLGGSSAACSEQEPAGPATPPSTGIVQPAGNGVPMSEGHACQTLVDAEIATRTRLGCAARSGPGCPDYLRPAGGEACLVYDQGSVTACASLMAGYARCDEFARRPCVVTALREREPNCPLGAGGAAGSAGNGGAAGSASTVGGATAQSGGTANSAGNAGFAGNANSRGGVLGKAGAGG